MTEMARLAVGAPNEDGPGDATPNAGQAFLFVRNGSVWGAQLELRAPNAGENDFLASVAVSDDGLIVVGAPGEDSNTLGIAPTASADNSTVDSGAIYIVQP